MKGDRRRTISNRMVAALEVERDTVFWDRELKGFGVRAYPGGGRVYVAQARGPKGPRRVTVGRHGVVNAEEAKRRAAHIIARVGAANRLDAPDLQAAAEPAEHEEPSGAEVPLRGVDDQAVARSQHRLHRLAAYPDDTQVGRLGAEFLADHGFGHPPERFFPLGLPAVRVRLGSGVSLDRELDLGHGDREGGGGPRNAALRERPPEILRRGIGFRVRAAAARLRHAPRNRRARRLDDRGAA